MIIVRILGGLASQFGKYAYVKKISDKLNTELCLDLSEYFDGYFRPFSLQYLNLEDVSIVDGICDMDSIVIISDGNSLIDAYENYNHRDNYYICNEEQDYKDFFDKYPEYVMNWRWDIIKHLQPSFESKFISDFQKLITGQYSVAVHIRRGDFVRLGWEDDTSLIKSTIGYVIKQHKDAQFYFFSNDIEWVKNEYGMVKSFHYINNARNIESDIEDIFAMAMCDLRIVPTLSGYSKLANYLSMGHNSDGAICIGDKKQAIGIINESLTKHDEYDGIYYLAESEIKEGYLEYTNINNCSSISVIERTDYTELSNNNRGQRIVLVTMEIGDVWKIKGVYRLAHKLAIDGYRVLYVNVNKKNVIYQYNKCADNFINATNMDGQYLGFESVFCNIGRVNKILDKKNDVIYSEIFLPRVNVNKLLPVNIHDFGKRDLMKYYASRILCYFSGLKMASNSNDSTVAHLRLSDVTEEFIQNYLLRKYEGILRKIN